MDAVRGVFLGAASVLVAGAVGVFIWLHVAENPSGTGGSISLAPSAVRPNAAGVGEIDGIQTRVASTTSERLQASPLVPAESFLTEAARKSQQVSTRLEAIWSAEKTNPTQTQQAEQALLAAMNSEGVLEIPEQPDRVVEIGCRASMCRIESEFPPGNSGSEWATRVLLVAAAEFGSSTFVSSSTETGESRLVVYAFRLGNDPGQ
jgi:hypothetical protein